MKVDPCQLGVVIKHALKVGCTTQYVWVVADRPVGAERAFQRAECLVIVGAGRTGLLTQFSKEFGDGSLQVARSTARLQDSDSLGWQRGSSRRDLLAYNVGKPT